jgi:hypothetical protein
VQVRASAAIRGMMAPPSHCSHYSCARGDRHRDRSHRYMKGSRETVLPGCCRRTHRGTHDAVRGVVPSAPRVRCTQR